MFTRKQYLNKECSHREYYAQFVTEPVKARVRMCIGWERLKNSTDEHLNDIPLREWDRLGPVYCGRDFWKSLGDTPSAAGLCCIYKEAARQIIEEGKQ